MRNIELTASKRDSSLNPKALRRDGEIPAVLYGAGGGNVDLKLNGRDFGRSGAGATGSHLIKFTSDDPSVTGSVALVKDIQVHPVTGAPLHVDFLRLDLSQPVEAEIPLNYTGKCVGVTDGGILQPIRRELTVRALPSVLPESIDVDVTELALHGVIHVEDLTLPEGVESNHQENFTLVTVAAPAAEKSAAAEAQEEESAATVAEPEKTD